MGRAAPVGLLLLGLACEKPEPPPAAPAPTPPRPATVPATRPAGPSTLTVGGRPITFPPARAILQEAGGTLTLTLFSDDPDALAKGPPDRYYIPLRLNLDDPALLDGHNLIQRSPSMERQDEDPTGIWLEGQSKFLQPHDLRLAFTLRGQELTVELQGYFLQFDNERETAPPQTTPVQGALRARLERGE